MTQSFSWYPYEKQGIRIAVGCLLYLKKKQVLVIRVVDNAHTVVSCFVQLIESACSNITPLFADCKQITTHDMNDTQRKATVSAFSRISCVGKGHYFIQYSGKLI